MTRRPSLVATSIHAVKDVPTARALATLEEATARSLELPFHEGRQVNDIVIATATRKRVAHGLGRAVRGWFVVRSNAGVLPYEESGNPYPERELWLTASGDVTISIWVY